MTRDEIFAAFAGRAPQYVSVHAPEIGAGRTLHVKVLSGEEDGHWAEKHAEHDGEGKGFAWFACCAVYDPETHKRIFNDLDLDNLNSLPASLLRRIWDVGATANGLTKRAQEELEKNSPTPSAASCSISTSRPETPEPTQTLADSTPAKSAS